MYYRCLLLLMLVANLSIGKVTCDFEDVDVRSVIEAIVSDVPLNVVFGKDVSGRVTLNIQDMEWNEALDAVTKITGLAYERFDNIVYVDFPDNIAERHTDNRKFEIYKVRDINLADITNKVSDLLSSKGIVMSDERTGQIIVYDNIDIQDKVRAFICALDKSELQVLLDVRVVDITAHRNDAVALVWNFGELLLPLQQIITADFMNSIEEGISGYLNINVTTDVLPDVNVLIQALSERSKSFSVTSGRFVIQNNYESSILTGSRFSVPLRDVSGNTTIQLFSSGFEITATPHITSNKHINIKIKITLSDLDRASALIGRPIMSTLETEVTLHLSNGQTAMIVSQSGDNKSDQDKSLGQPRIPLVEYLMKPWSSSDDVKCQYILITPFIIE